MKRLKILIIIGHGGNDVGAVSGNLKELVCNVNIATAMFNAMKPYCDVTIETNNTPLEGEIALVNSGNWDIVISVHNNAGGGDGFEAYYYSGDNEMLKMLQSIEKEVVKIGQNSRGLKPNTTFRIIRAVKPSSVILEGFFLDNANDRSQFDELHEQQALGMAYAKGVMNYLGVNYTPPTTPSTSNKMYRVITGSFKERKNAENRLQELKNKGFDSFIEVK